MKCHIQLSGNSIFELWKSVVSFMISPRHKYTYTHKHNTHMHNNTQHNSCTWAHYAVYVTDIYETYIICHKAIVMITERTYCFHNNMLRRKPWPISSFALIYVTDICTMAKLKKPDKKNFSKGTHHTLPSCSLGHCFYFSFLFGTRETLEMYHQINYLPPVQLETSAPPPLPFGKTYLLKDFPQQLNSS